MDSPKPKDHKKSKWSHPNNPRDLRSICDVSTTIGRKPKPLERDRICPNDNQSVDEIVFIEDWSDVKFSNWENIPHIKEPEYELHDISCENEEDWTDDEIKGWQDLPRVKYTE